MPRFFKLYVLLSFLICGLHAEQIIYRNDLALINKFHKAGHYKLAKQKLEKIVISKNNKIFLQACFMLANYYFEGRKEIAKNSVKAKKYYNLALAQALSKAHDGDAEIQYIAGICLKNLKRNEEAYAWLLKSAENGNFDAQAAVALSLLKGKGVKRDAKTAMEWLKKAVANNNMEAKAYLASYYLGSKKNIAEGIKLAEESAKTGNAAGQYTLGMAYQKGRGVPKSLAKAVELFRLAADQGQKDAIVRLKWTEKLLKQKN